MSGFFGGDRGLRLKEERKRLRLIQVKAAELVGVRENAYINYEKPEDDPKRREPNLAQLAALAAVGVDALYVVTGQRSSLSALPDLEQEVVGLLRQIAPDQREGFMLLARTYATAHGGQ